MSDIEKAKKILRKLCDAIVEAVEEFPQGAPAGPMFMALNSCGMTLDTFEKVMDALVTAGRLRKSGHQYFPVAKKGGGA